MNISDRELGWILDRVLSRPWCVRLLLLLLQPDLTRATTFILQGTGRAQSFKPVFTKQSEKQNMQTKHSGNAQDHGGPTTNIGQQLDRSSSSSGTCERSGHIHAYDR